MTDTYLRSLGFAPIRQESRASRNNFSQTWSYQFNHAARDGVRLYIEHPLGIDGCRLSTLAAPIAAQDVFATVDLHDRPGLETAIKDFYAAHGGMGPQVSSFAPHPFRPYRRQE
ncbi:hypothetical protein E4631_06210 [Hymenobacter sp. UV11]|uniref:hypothetical protein n=1 Tax=Hymenobacter sp. UV11 TaxID=1849735 RepID=UPI00105C9B48|nr:hypothetical protein [Hymenobacter sp. UV11]TDN38252.1 hypothetical protein A8B98_24925 [Hymenobacter sp. UV11]TFZ67570.1 hypothetical protein E4631_06210 [Hymenobacter sp. UV11]